MVIVQKVYLPNLLLQNLMVGESYVYFGMFQKVHKYMYNSNNIKNSGVTSFIISQLYTLNYLWHTELWLIQQIIVLKSHKMSIQHKNKKQETKKITWKFSSRNHFRPFNLSSTNINLQNNPLTFIKPIFFWNTWQSQVETASFLQPTFLQPPFGTSLPICVLGNPLQFWIGVVLSI